MKRNLITACAILYFLSSGAAAYTTRMGAITQDETWSGDIVIVGDVSVARDVTLRLSDDCRLYVHDADLLHSGSNPAAVEFESAGRVVDSAGLSVERLPLRPIGNLLDGTESQLALLRPSPLATRTLQDQWHRDRRHYSLLWPLLYAGYLIF